MTRETDKWADDTWKTPKYACLACGYVVDAASHSPLEPNPRRPQAGDVTICLKCSHIAVFNEDLTIRNPTADELADIVDEPDVQKLLWAMAAARGARHG